MNTSTQVKVVQRLSPEQVIATLSSGGAVELHVTKALKKMGIPEMVKLLIEGGAVEIRSVPAKVTNDEVQGLPPEKQPFLYSSGNWGPGYVTVKGMVGQDSTIIPLMEQMAIRVAEHFPDVQFVAGNVTGGLVPGWNLHELLGCLLGRPIPFVYVRDTRKSGGQKEVITGVQGNSNIKQGFKGLVVEEMTNFNETTCNSAKVLRESGYQITHAACMLTYGNPVGEQNLQNTQLTLISCFSLHDILDVAANDGRFPSNAVADYRAFLQNPPAWMASHGLTRVEKGGTK